MQWLKFSLILLVAGYCPLTQAQKATQPLSWQQMTLASGYIFSGTVTAIEHVPEAASGGVAAVRVTFQIEQAIRGVQPGQTLLVREWAGLWDSPQRYRIGERLLLFLYPPSKLGLTSPVGGALGRFEIDAEGKVVMDRGRVDPPSPVPMPPNHVLQRGQTRANVYEFCRAIRRMAEE